VFEVIIHDVQTEHFWICCKTTLPQLVQNSCGRCR